MTLQNFQVLWGDSMYSFIRGAALGAVLMLAFPLTAMPVAAQSGGPPTPPPSISTSAVGETTVVPDRAMVSVAVESQGPTAAAAGAENAKLQTRVIDAVKAAGIAAAQIRTSGYNVFPEYTQPTGAKGPRISGYRAHNTVQVEIRNLESVGKVIDAVLGAGATNLGGLSLYASNTDAARRDALQKAVAKARSDAEVTAAAAGGSLGALLEISTEPFGVPQPIYRNLAVAEGRAAMAAPTPVEAGEMTVQAVVHVRWQFVPGR
jgi:uncharacterized protein YggE